MMAATFLPSSGLNTRTTTSLEATLGAQVLERRTQLKAEGEVRAWCVHKHTNTEMLVGNLRCTTEKTYSTLSLGKQHASSHSAALSM